MTREGICFYFQAELSQSVCPQRSPVVINCPGPSKAARQCLWCAHRQSPVRKEQGHRKMLWHRRGSPLWIQNCTRRLQAGDTRTQISVLAPANALLWYRESEQGDAAPQEIHIEMELKITVAWDWIAPHWVSSLAANEPPRRIKLFPGLLGSWVWVVEEWIELLGWIWDQMAQGTTVQGKYTGISCLCDSGRWFPS